MILEQDKDTIAAVSTAPGTGGIAVVRISGSRALEITKKLARFLPESPESHRIYFGTLRAIDSQDPIDEVLVSYFANGRSFTGEEVLEISCHGGEWITHEILQNLLSAGARAARRGEFTYRAFMNGKIDLVQAEAVLSLIESRSSLAARSALSQLKGSLSKEVKSLLDGVTWVAANLEANIDFAQEDIVAAETETLVRRLEKLSADLDQLLSSESKRRLWDQGYHAVLTGVPNVGKSSLLNAWLNEDRAIVTDIPGTTRDFVDGFVEVSGVRVRLTDTAGLRTTTDVVESVGVQKTLSLLPKADLVFFVFVSDEVDQTAEEFLRVFSGQTENMVLVHNKSDLFSGSMGHFLSHVALKLKQRDAKAEQAWEKLCQLGVVRVSAMDRAGIQDLVGLVSKRLKERIGEESPIAISARHSELLRETQSSLGRAIASLKENASPEFTAFELKEAVFSLHEILGIQFDDQVMDRVFNEFCLGK